MKSRVTFINRFYWPDEPATSQLLTDLAEALADRGHSVQVLASRPNGEAIPVVAHRNGVEICRVSQRRWGDRGLTGRSIDYAAYILGVAWRLFRRTQWGEIVVFMTDPPLLGVIAWPIVALRGGRCIHWVQDTYPEIAVELTGHKWLRCMLPLRNWSWRQSYFCVTLGHDMAAVIARAGVHESRIKIIHNWAPAGLGIITPKDLHTQKAKFNLNGKFVVMYSGNLGRVHDLDPILEVANLLRDEPDIIFLFVGHGAQLASLTTSAQNRGLINIRFLPPQPRADLSQTLAMGDIHFVTLRPGCEPYVFPSKFYGILAIGRPMIFVGPPTCDLARIIREHELGVDFSRENHDSIARAIIQFRDNPKMSDQVAWADRHYASSHNLTTAVEAWHDLLTREPDLADD